MSLGCVELWDPRRYQTRHEELTQAFLAQLINEDMQREALEAKKRFEPVTPYHFENPYYGREKFIDQAKKLAEETIEQERKIYVDSRAERDKAMITEIARQLRFFVYGVNEKGEAEKLKIFVERVTEPNHRGDYETHDIMYVGDRDFQRLNQINALKQRLGELSDFYPYYDEEVKALYDQAAELGSLEVVRKGEAPQASEVATKPVTKSKVVIKKSTKKASQ